MAVKNLESEKKNLLKSVEVLKKKSNVKPSNHNDCDKKVKDLMIERLNLFQNLTEENNKVVALEKKLSDFETSMTDTTDENISLKKNQKELDNALKTFKSKIEEFTEDKRKLEDAKKKVKALEEDRNLAMKSFTQKLENEKKNTQKEQKKIKELRKKIEDLEEEVKRKNQPITQNFDVDIMESSYKVERMNSPKPSDKKKDIGEVENDITELSSPKKTSASTNDKLGTNKSDNILDLSPEKASGNVEENVDNDKSPFQDDSLQLPSFDKIMSKYENLVMPTKILNFSFADNGNDSKENTSKEISKEDKHKEISKDDDIDSLLDDIEQPAMDKDISTAKENVDLTIDEEDDIEKDLTIDFEAIDSPEEELTPVRNVEEEEDLEITFKDPHKTILKPLTEVKLMFVSDEKVDPVREVQDLETNATTIFDAIKELEDMKTPSAISNNLENETSEKQHENIQNHCSSCGTDLKSSPGHLIEDQCRKKMEYVQEGLEISCDYCSVKMDHWVTACKLLISFCEICHCWGHDGDTHVTDSEIPNDNDFTVTYSENKKLEAMLESYNQIRTQHYTYESHQLPENTLSEDGRYKYSGTIEDVKKLLDSK